MFNNFKKDPLAESVSKIMSDNDVRRQVESQLNEELGIFNKRALPHEYVAEYETVLEGRIKDALEGATRKELTGTDKVESSIMLAKAKAKFVGTKMGTGNASLKSDGSDYMDRVKSKPFTDGSDGTSKGSGKSMKESHKDTIIKGIKAKLNTGTDKVESSIMLAKAKAKFVGTKMGTGNASLKAPLKEQQYGVSLDPIQEEIRRNIILQMDYLSTMPTDDKLLAYVNGLTEDQKELIDDLLEEETFEEETLEEKSKWDESTRLGAKPQTVVAKNPMMMPRPVSTPTSAQTTPRDAGKPITPPVLADTAKEMTKSNPAADMASMFRNGGSGAKTLKPGSKSTAKSLKESAPKMSLENMLRLHKPEDIPHTGVLKESFEHFLRTKLPEE